MSSPTDCVPPNVWSKPFAMQAMANEVRQSAALQGKIAVPSSAMISPFAIGRAVSADL